MHSSCGKPCLPASQGNLSEFVKVRPEARSYYELSAAKLKFNLPKPGFLDGVKSRVRRCSPHVMKDTPCMLLHPMAARPVHDAAKYSLCNCQSAVGHLEFAFVCIQ